MTSSSKSKPVSKAAQSIEVAATKKIELIANQHEGVISLAQGIPSFPTPDYIKKAAKKAIDQDLVGKYTSGYGILDLRHAIAEKVKQDNGIDISFGQTLVTHGGIEALMAVFMTILNPDDDIIVLTPDYASHLMQIKVVLQGRNAIQVPLDETNDGWSLNAKKLEQAITKKTKAILFTNPCNPTGKVYSEKELKEIAKIAKKHNLYIISDEMYEYFVFDGKKHMSIGSFEEVKDKTISVFGVSKSYAMTGWRIGYIVAPKELIEQIFKIHDSLVTCPAAVSQYAALAALEGDKKAVEHFKKEFEKRRAITEEALRKLDFFEVRKPEGGYYIFIKAKKKIDENKFVTNAIMDAKVAVIPGSPFGKGGENYFRISFGAEEKILQEGLKRFVNYIKEYW